MAGSLRHLKGLPYELQVNLASEKLTTYDHIHRASRTAAQRQALAERLGVERGVIDALAERADLACLKGVGGVFARLLTEAGITTVEDLAAQKSTPLYYKLVEFNRQTRLAGRAPTLRAVAGWVAEAQAVSQEIAQ